MPPGMLNGNIIEVRNKIDQRNTDLNNDILVQSSNLTQNNTQFIITQAIQLEKDLRKEQILEAYLNTIYLGSGAYGVNAASQTYVRKNANDLTIAEAALIAGITQNPFNHSPIKVLKKEDVSEDDYIIDSNDEIYTTIFNEESIDRYHSVLGFMKLEV